MEKIKETAEDILSLFKQLFTTNKYMIYIYDIEKYKWQIYIYKNLKITLQTNNENVTKCEDIGVENILDYFNNCNKIKIKYVVYYDDYNNYINDMFNIFNNIKDICNNKNIEIIRLISYN